MTVAGIRGNRSHGSNWSDSGNVWELLLLVLTVDDEGWGGGEKKRRATCDSPKKPPNAAEN